MAKSDFIAKREFEHILAALMPANRLALEIALATGLRISDVLALTTDQLYKGAVHDENGRVTGARFTVREHKTRKRRRVYVTGELVRDAMGQAGLIYVFPSKCYEDRHRTRQAVYKDLRRVADMWRLPGNLVISPHTARKVYAVSKYQSGASLKKVQELLNHGDQTTTMIYAMADAVTARKLGRKRGNEDV